MSRRMARERVLQALYQAEITEKEVEEALINTLAMARLDSRVQGFAEKIARGAWSQRETIDSHIEKFTSHWKVERLATIDRNILRLAIYEMLHEKEIPLDVSINEAIELAKKYSTDKAAAFINGILDSFKKQLFSDGDKFVL